MRDWFVGLFDKHRFGLEINCFDWWHIGYLILIFGVTLLIGFLIRNKSEKVKHITLNTVLIIAITSYVLDFFLMPFSEGKIDMDKLPFHICTSISIIAMFAHFNKHFSWFKTPAVVLCIVAPLMYMTYPGSALGNISPLSYKVTQTFFYHGLLFTYGCLALSTGEVKLNIKQIWKELVVILGIAIWAGIGNYLYLDVQGSDWFFLRGSIFPAGFPAWAVPPTVIICVFGMVALIYGIYYLVNFIIKKVQSKKQVKLTTAENVDNTNTKAE